MNSVNNFKAAVSAAGAGPQDRSGAPDKPTVRVKELSERDRRRILRHFLALDDVDRDLRFGIRISDEMITQYVNQLDFSHDTIFGVYGAKFKLVGVGHLAFAPREAHPDSISATLKDRVAELGVSVSVSGRGQGVGSKLFERAAMHCRNADVDTLYMHCLASNQVMIHIAKKAGMQIHRDYGEADAYLKLLPASPGSVFKEAVEEQAATLDYAFKANTRAAVKWLAKLLGFKRG